MGARNSFKWTKQITPSLVVQLLRSQKDIKKATLIFDSATAEYSAGFRHDHTTFGLMISKLVSANQFRHAELLLERMKEENCSVTEDIFLSLCRGYGRVHRPLDSIRVFKKMESFGCEPSEKAYVTVFAILVEENQLKVAMRFYRYMREMGVLPSVVSLNVLIKALCMSSGGLDSALRIFREMPNRGCSPDSYTYGTLINGLCRLGKVCEAKELFREMEEKGCSPSVVTYTSLIHGLCQSKDIDAAMAMLEEMGSKGIEPNVVTFSCIMDGLCKDWRSSQAVELMEMMVGKRLKPNFITYSTLIDGLCREGKLPKAVEIFDRMKLQGLKPDAGLYGKIINAFCDVSKFHEAANFLDEMVLEGVSPNRVTWTLHVRTNNRVVQGLCSSGNLDRAFQLYLSLRARGISVEAETFDSLVQQYCNKGDIHKAARIMDEMVLDGCIPGKGTWKAVVDGFWDRRMVRESFESVLVKLMAEFFASTQ